MSAEVVILGALINGPLPRRSIPLDSNECQNVGRSLEKRGLLLRGQDAWRLTKAGICYAVTAYTILPNPIAYELTGSTELMPEYVDKIDVKRRYFLGYRAVLYPSVVLILAIISYALGRSGVLL